MCSRALTSSQKLGWLPLNMATSFTISDLQCLVQWLRNISLTSAWLWVISSQWANSKWPNSHRAVRTLVHCMPGLPASSYLPLQPFPRQQEGNESAVPETYNTMGGRRPKGQPCWGQMPPEAGCLPTSCSLPSLSEWKDMQLLYLPAKSSDLESKYTYLSKYIGSIPGLFCGNYL